MTRSRRIALVMMVMLAALLPAHDPLGSQGALTIGDYELVSVRAVDRNVNELTYRARLSNSGPPLRAATAHALSLNKRLTIVDATLSFGSLGTGSSVASSDTFSLLAPARPPIKWSNIQWTIVPSVNLPAVANAGPDQTVLLGATVILNGSGSSDADGDPLTYAWTLVSRPVGSSATLSGAASASPSFVADDPGSYIVQLVANDGAVDSEPDVVIVNTQNSAPVADAGSDQNARVTERVTLDGSGSSDADGDLLTFSWALISKPAASATTLSDPAAVRPELVVDVPGRYVVQLVVRDGVIDSVPDSVVVSTSNTVPVAHAGSDRTVRVGETVPLDGSGSTDLDGDTLSYAWALISRPAGSGAQLSDASVVMPGFVIDRPGTYVAQLIVQDGIDASLPDTVTITTANSPPVANAGADQTVIAGQMVILDGTQSLDVDGDPVSYHWSIIARPTDSTATLPDPSSPGPTFVVDRPGTYVIQLIVHDGAVNSDPDSVTVTTTNSPPTAAAGPDQLDAIVGQAVMLDGLQSSDPDGHPLTYAWSLLARPPGSTAALDDPSAVGPSFTPDVTGDYVAQLIVHDGFVPGGPDTVLIRAVGGASAALTVSGGSVSTGDVIVGIVTFSDPAPAGGTTVALASSAPERILLPATAFVAAGAFQGFFAIDGLSAGAATITASAGAIGTATAPVMVLERGFEFGPELHGVNAGATVQGTIVLDLPASAAGARLRVESQHPALIGVQSTPVLIAAGEQVGVFTVTGIAPGTARVIATAESGVQGQASRFVGVAEVAGDPTRTSDDLIEEAREAGTLSEEEALLYRVYAAFGSPNLPAAYRGRVDPQLDTRLGVEINERWSSLSVGVQAAIVPFIMPPLYEGSWGDPNSSAMAGQVSIGASAASSMRIALNAAEVDPNPCGPIGHDRAPIPLRAWARHVTTHFNFWYRTEPVPWNAISPEQGAQAAGNLAAIGEEVYAKLTGAMGREPASDAGIPCNGGDGKLDVYIERVSAKPVAQVVAYPGGCDQSPAFMWMKGEHALNAEEARDVFAHEFMHMIQLAYTKGTSCTDYGWIDEATANWAIDFVYQKDDYEHQFFKAALTEPGQADGSFRKDLTEIALPLDLGVNRRSLTTFCNGSGYCDYPFFLYIARRFGPSTIRRTYEGSELLDPIASVEYGVNQGSLRTVWHDYSLALYNDFTNNVAKSFHDWDDLVNGIRLTSLDLGWDEPAEIEVSLGGAPNRGFMAETAAALGNRDGRNPGHSPIYRLSTRAVSYKITDPQVNYITFQNTAAVAPFANLKLWAIQKIDGAWRQPEDWTRKKSAVFCRDVDDEKLEELVLIYSNGDSASRNEQPGWFLDLDPANTKDENSLLPQFRASNAGCYRWTGTTSVTQTNQHGGTYEASATVTFERVRDDVAPDGIPGEEWFKPVSGTATVQRSGLDGNGLCTETIDSTSGPIGGDDTSLLFHLDSPDHPNDRSAIGGGLTTIQNAHRTFTCGDDVLFDGVAPANALWLQFPQSPQDLIGADGRTLSGSASEVLADGSTTQVARWNLRAERKQ